MNDVQINDQMPVLCEDMTLRDYFAAAALSANPVGGFCGTNVKTIAEFMYLLADAMLAEREKTK